MTRARYRDVNLLSVPEAGIVMGKGSTAVHKAIGAEEAFRELLVPIPGEFVTISLPKLVRYICKNDEADVAEMLPRMRSLIAAHRAGELS